MKVAHNNVAYDNVTHNNVTHNNVAHNNVAHNNVAHTPPPLPAQVPRDTAQRLPPRRRAVKSV